MTFCFASFGRLIIAANPFRTLWDQQDERSNLINSGEIISLRTPFWIVLRIESNGHHSVNKALDAFH